MAEPGDAPADDPVDLSKSDMGALNSNRVGGGICGKGCWTTGFRTPMKDEKR